MVKRNLVIALLGRYAISARGVGGSDQLHKHWDSVVWPFQHLPPSSSFSILFQLLNNHLPRVVSYHRFQSDGSLPTQGLWRGVSEGQASCKHFSNHWDHSLHPPPGLPWENWLCLDICVKLRCTLKYHYPPTPSKKKVGDMFRCASSIQPSRKREESNRSQVPPPGDSSSFADSAEEVVEATEGNTCSRRKSQAILSQAVLLFKVQFSLPSWAQIRTSNFSCLVERGWGPCSWRIVSPLLLCRNTW